MKATERPSIGQICNILLGNKKYLFYALKTTLGVFKVTLDINQTGITSSAIYNYKNVHHGQENLMNTEKNHKGAKT